MTRSAQTTVRPGPTIDHRVAISHAEVAYDRFAEVVESIRPHEWDLPTDCELWTVRDLVGHVVGAMRSAASVREFVSQQREIKSHVKRHGGNETDVMTQVQVERTADLSTTELVAECRAKVRRAAIGRGRFPRLVRRRATFPVEIGSLVETWSLGYLVDVILTRDSWLHRIDLCRALDRDIVLTADHDGMIVADVVHEWARRHGAPYRLELTGPAGGSFASSDGSVTAEQLSLDAVEFCRTLSGRRPGAGLLAVEVPF